MSSVIPFFKNFKTPIIFAICSILIYYSFAYNLERTEYVKLISLYLILFFFFFKIIRLKLESTKILTWFSFGFRVIFLFAIPNLSQDFYRFIWDGRMILEGFNPYLNTPEFFISRMDFPVNQAQILYDGMGILNGSHFTNYPPLKQLCFVIVNVFSKQSVLGSILGLRFLIIAADFGTLFFGKKLLKRLKLPEKNIFLYLLNPFIIIELTGNLHFEGVMIFFLVWSLYLLDIGRWRFAALVLALSISVKLIPLIFLPLFFQKLGWRKSMVFYGIIGVVTILLFTPFYSTQFLLNYTETVGLWFQNFEFNGSLYLILREIGYLFRGYNEIALIGTYTAVFVFIIIVSMSLFRKNNQMVSLITGMLLALSIYYFTATTVHPWYVATLLFLCIFTSYKFPLVWSLTIILSYLSYINIGNAEKTENIWVIALEYLLVYGVFMWELFVNRTTKKVF